MTIRNDEARAMLMCINEMSFYFAMRCNFYTFVAN